MSTTTVRFPDELKARVSKLAKQAGISAHSYIVLAVERETQRNEARADFVRSARSRLDEMDRSGEGVPWDDVRAYLTARAAGKRVARPQARKTRR
jgi:predicted transcriptional regulator